MPVPLDNLNCQPRNTFGLWLLHPQHGCHLWHLDPRPRNHSLVNKDIDKRLVGTEKEKKCRHRKTSMSMAIMTSLGSLCCFGGWNVWPWSNQTFATHWLTSQWKMPVLLFARLNLQLALLWFKPCTLSPGFPDKPCNEEAPPLALGWRRRSLSSSQSALPTKCFSLLYTSLICWEINTHWLRYCYQWWWCNWHVTNSYFWLQEMLGIDYLTGVME